MRQAAQELPAWGALEEHAGEARGWRLADLVDAPGRFREFSVPCGGRGGPELFLDYSRQRVTQDTLRLLVELAGAREVEGAREALFTGGIVNVSEGRPALHPDARAAKPGNPVLAEQRRRVLAFTQRFAAGEALGMRGKPLARVINIGIGGSDLGARLLCSALGDETSLPVDFVSEMDGLELRRALENGPAEETLFVVCSKSFSTSETLANAGAARRWLAAQLGQEAVAAHFAAASSNAGAMTAWGVAPEMQFHMPDAISGRYSVWSAAGLSVWLALGGARMTAFLGGGHWLDRHFLGAPAARNLPILMALLALWNQTFLGCSSQLLLPYDTRLALLPAYLQQLEMESLGKSADAHGRALAVDGAAALFGMTGSSAQHSIMQWAQQGGRALSADFIAVRNADAADPGMHAEALRHMLAQAEALARGLPRSEIASDPLAAHKALPGGRASNVLLLKALDPEHLGALIALHEHKVFVQATLLGVNPFDQWGVEYAKRLAAREDAQPPLADFFCG